MERRTLASYHLHTLLQIVWAAGCMEIYSPCSGFDNPSQDPFELLKTCSKPEDALSLVMSDLDLRMDPCTLNMATYTDY